MKHLILIVLVVAFIFSCSKKRDKDSCGDFDATYDGEVKGIIERACNGRICHVGPKGFELGNILIWFDTYENMLYYLENGRLEKSLFDDEAIKKMPPLWAEERQLSEVETQILKCWLDNGYPEN